MNSAAPWPGPDAAQERVLGIQRKLHKWAEDDQDRRFSDLHNLVCDPATLMVAWQRVRANRGSRSAGVDRQNAYDIERRLGVERFLGELREELRAGNFRPAPVKERLIPKRGGRLRRLGIATVRDRVVQAALKLVLEPIFEADFQPCSYGFRPGRRAQDAVAEIHYLTSAPRNYEWIVEADIEACFDEIDHDALVAQIERRVCDRRMLKLLRGWLRAGVFEGGIVSAIDAGTPQGSPISPLLANVALHVLDQAWQGGGQRVGVLVRYADDLVVLCATREQAEQARELVAAVLDMLGLRLHPEKTRTARLARGAEGFTFLGFEHRMRESWRQPGRWYLQKWPSRRAMASIRGKIRARTERRYARLPLEWAVEDLNRVLRGWGNYFRHGNSARKFAQIDSYVNERLAILASAKHGLQGRNWVSRFNYEWSTRLGIYRLTGTVKPTVAYASR